MFVWLSFDDVYMRFHGQRRRWRFANVYDTETSKDWKTSQTSNSMRCFYSTTIHLNVSLSQSLIRYANLKWNQFTIQIGWNAPWKLKFTSHESLHWQFCHQMTRQCAYSVISMPHIDWSIWWLVDLICVLSCHDYGYLNIATNSQLICSKSTWNCFRLHFFPFFRFHSAAWFSPSICLWLTAHRYARCCGCSGIDFNWKYAASALWFHFILLWDGLKATGRLAWRFSKRRK